MNKNFIGNNRTVFLFSMMLIASLKGCSQCSIYRDLSRADSAFITIGFIDNRSDNIYHFEYEYLQKEDTIISQSRLYPLFPDPAVHFTNGLCVVHKVSTFIAKNTKQRVGPKWKLKTITVVDLEKVGIFYTEKDVHHLLQLYELKTMTKTIGHVTKLYAVKNSD